MSVACGRVARAALRLLALAVCGATALHGEQFDVLIRGGRVLDGSATPWFAADIGLRGDRIAAVGRLTDATAPIVVDANGLFVAPGFIDGHSHAGPGVTEEKTSGALPLLMQGVTTAFINPDGGGPIDLVAQRRAIERQHPGVNVAQLIGHNSVRLAVLGEADRAPNEAELGKMAELVRRGFLAGAFGLSAGPFYSPGNFAQLDEHVTLARIAAEFDGFYTSHIRDESDYNIGVVAAVDEVIAVAREARLPGIVTTIRCAGPRVWGASAEIVRHIERARADGVELFADQEPFEASTTGLVAALVPAWAQAGGVNALRARLADAKQRAAIRSAMAENLERHGGAARVLLRNYRPDPRLEGCRLEAVARDRKREPVDAAIELVAAGDPVVAIFDVEEKDLRAFMTQPWVLACSDGELVAPGEGMPHPRSFGAFARRLHRYVQEEKTLTLEQAVHAMTGLPATVFRLRDRGMIRVGAFADLVVFDLTAVQDRATYERPHQLASGMRFVFVNGRLAIADGQPTENRGGRVLARGQ